MHTPAYDSTIIARPKMAEERNYGPASRAVLGAHMDLVDFLRTTLQAPLELEGVERAKGEDTYPGISAASLNAAIRSALGRSDQCRFEVSVESGVLLPNAAPLLRPFGEMPPQRFDFAFYEDRQNAQRLYASLHGPRAPQAGPQVWEHFRSSNEGLAAEVERIASAGEGLRVAPAMPNVLGELQFGNWAMFYADMVKASKAAQFDTIDLYVYVVAHGNLAEMLSDQTVSFEAAARFLDANSDPQRRVFTLPPVWLVGLDIDSPLDMSSHRG